MGSFHTTLLTKSLAVSMILLHALGSKGKPEPSRKPQQAGTSAVIGLVLLFGSVALLYRKANFTPALIDPLYIGLTLIGCVKLVKAGQLLPRLLFSRPRNDIFNEENDEFSPNEEHVENEYAIHFETLHHFKGKCREGAVPIIDRKYAEEMPVAGHDSYEVLPDEEKQYRRNRLLQKQHYRVKQDIGLLIRYESERHNLTLDQAQG